MTNRNKKRALFASAVAMLLCVTMLVGTTYAWFTDTEATGKNIIKSGNLDVELSFYRPVDGETVTDLENVAWSDVDGSTEVFDEDALWEPGYTQIVYFKVENVGSLALKYNMSENIYTEKSGINQANEIFFLSDYLYTAVLMDKDADDITAIATRADAVNLAVNPIGTSEADGTLAAGAVKYGAMIVTMPTTVGNEANHLIGLNNQPEIGLGLTLVATQEMAEDDSFGTDYDNGATYPDAFDVVDAAGLAEALAADAEGAKVIDMKADIVVDEVMTVSGDIILNLNGNDIESAVEAGRVFKMADNATLTINAEDQIIEIGTDSYGVVEIPAGVTGATVNMNGGTYVGTTDDGAFLKVRPGADKVTVTLNDVTYTDTESNPTTGDKNSWIVNSNDFDGEMSLMINGGSYTSAAGIQVENGSLTIDGATIKTKSVGFEIAGTAIITNCRISIVAPASTVSSAPSAAIAVSGNGFALVTDCTISLAKPNNTVSFAVYSSGGSIVATGNSWSTYKVHDMDYSEYPDAVYDVYIEDAHGNVVADING